MLDALILMSPGGRVVYMGPCGDSVPYFAALGYSCPNETNPAEFFIDLVSIDTDDPIQAKKDRDRINRLATAFQKHNRKISMSLGDLRQSSALGSMPNRHSLVELSIGRVIRRFGALLRRSWRQTYRSIGLNAGRLAISSGTALLLSQIFPSVVKGPPTNTSVTDRICVLTFGAITNFLVAVVKTLGIFSKEKPVVQRERHRKDYTNIEYIFAKALSEFPLDAAFATVFTTTLKLVTGLAIGWKQLSLVFSLMTISGASLGFLLGGVTNSEDEAIVLAMPVVILFMVVGVINPSGVDPNKSSPPLLQALKFFSPIAAAIDASIVAEFSGMKFATSSMLGLRRFRDLPRMGGLALVRSGNEALYALGLGNVSFDAVISHMTTLVFVNFALSWLGLSLAGTQKVQRWIRSIRGSLSPQKTEANDQTGPAPQPASRWADCGLPITKFQLGWRFECSGIPIPSEIHD
jgi:ABC-2 type transporter